MSRILLLSYLFPPENSAAAVRPGQLYDFLPKHGYKPFVVASSEGAAAGGADVVRVPCASEALLTSSASAAAGIFMRFCAPYNDRLPWVPYAIRAGAHALRSISATAIYSTSPFLASHFAAAWLKRKFRLPWIADFQDPVADNPFRTRAWPYPYDKLLERLIFENADHLIANTDTVAAAWTERYPQHARKISVLWNSFDPREAIPVSSAAPREYRVISHVGTLYGGRHPELMLAALGRLRTALADLRVNLIGPIEPQILERLKTQFAWMHDERILEYNDATVSRAEALQATANADYLLLLDMNEKNASFQLPSKLLDYIRVGKPVLAYTPNGSPVERVLQRSGIPFLAIDPAGDATGTDDQLRDFLHSPAQTASPSPWFRDNFGADTQALIVKNILDGLAAGVPAKSVISPFQKTCEP